MDKIKLMISSKVVGLEAERDAVAQLFSNHPMIELLGAEPFSESSVAKSSSVYTRQMAKNCDLYILILGPEYGFELEKIGESATEVEFDEAYKQDPTKILVFLKEGEAKDEKQRKFISKVTEYYSGYWRTTFKYPHQLEKLVNESVMSWIKDRAMLGSQVSQCEHFIRQAIQFKSNPDIKIYYRVEEEYVEVEYKGMGGSFITQTERNKIISDFWKSVSDLQDSIKEWEKTWK